MRVPAALLIVGALLLVLALPCADAGKTWSLATNLTLGSETLNGTMLNAAANASETTSSVTVVLHDCTVEGGGLTVNGTATALQVAPTILMSILDTSVANASMVFVGYLPNASYVRIVNVTATMADSTPLFHLQAFYLDAEGGSSMTIQRVRASWGAGDGGSVVKLDCPKSFVTLPGRIFSFSEAVVTSAAHVLEITSSCEAGICFNTQNGLNAFDLIEFHDPRGAFVYSDAAHVTMASSDHGMIRFSNITMTGDKPFLSTTAESDFSVHSTNFGNVVFSGITTPNSLFEFNYDKPVVAQGANVKYTLRHINVKSVLSSSMPNTTVPMPSGAASDDSSTWYFYMGNITVNGTLLETLQKLDDKQLLASVQVNEYGLVLASRGLDYPTKNYSSASGEYCIIGRDGNAAFVPLANGVQRAECHCDTAYSPPYCTSVVDPLVYYDAYSPSPSACAVAKCESCLNGQASECGGCAFGYRLTASLGCAIIPCDVAHCTSCQLGSGVVCAECADGYFMSDNQSSCNSCGVSDCAHCTTTGVCDSCADGYVLTTTHTCSECTVSHCSQCVSPGDGKQCDVCAGGYNVSDDHSTCFSCSTPSCSHCIANDVCGACESNYKLTVNGTCKKKGTPWWVWLIVGIAAAAVVAAVIVIVVCCHRRRRGTASESTPPVNSDSHPSRDSSNATELSRYDVFMNMGGSGVSHPAATAAFPWGSGDYDYALLPPCQEPQAVSANPLDANSH